MDNLDLCSTKYFVIRLKNRHNIEFEYRKRDPPLGMATKPVSMGTRPNQPRFDRFSSI